MQDNITNLSLSCEDKIDKIAENFRNIGKEFQAMGLRHKLHYELAGNEDIAMAGAKLELAKEQPNIMLVLKEVKEAILDGYKGLSEELSIDIVYF